MNKNLQRIFLPMILAGVFVWAFMVIVPAVATPDTPTSRDLTDAAITITFWHHNSYGDRAKAITDLTAEFNATNPYSITVVEIPAGGYGAIYDQVIEGIQTGITLPNVVVAYPNSFADFARYGKVRFLVDYIEDPTFGITDTDDFYPGVMNYYRLGEYGNQVAGLQIGRSIDVMYYNADMLAGEGITVPMTWEAFETAVVSLTTETVSGTIIDTEPSRFALWLWSRGGELFSMDRRSAIFNNTPGVNSMAFLQDLLDEGYARLPRELHDAQNSFSQGTTGFTFGGSAGMPYYRDAVANGNNHAWGVSHHPADPGFEVVNSYGAGLGILDLGEEANLAAWRYIKWLTDRDQTARWAAISGYFPVRISAVGHISMTEKLAGDPQYAQAYTLLPMGKSEPAVRGYISIRGTIKTAMEDIFVAGAEVTGTLNNAATEANAILAATGPSSAVIPPEGGTVVYSNTNGLTTTVEIPAGASPVTETISIVPLDDLPTEGLAFALVPNLTFSQPVTITIHYSDTDIVGMVEENLELYIYDWATNEWVSADPCGGYFRDPENNILQAGLCHFSDYALADVGQKLFLPVVISGIEP